MSDLFNNPMINAVRESMSAEDLEKYKRIGESMYANIDYEKAAVSNMPPEMEDYLVYINGAIKSGLHPSMLSTDEKKFMNEIVGEKWYEDYGYTKEDLDDIVTVKFE